MHGNNKEDTQTQLIQLLHKANIVILQKLFVYIIYTNSHIHILFIRLKVYHAIIIVIFKNICVHILYIHPHTFIYHKAEGASCNHILLTTKY